MSVSATIVVHFGDDVDANTFAMAMLDSELNVDAEGEEITSFVPGDEIFFLIQHDPSLRIDGLPKATDGTVVAQPDKEFVFTEQELIFEEGAGVGDRAEVGGPDLAAVHRGDITKTWYGREGIGFEVKNRKATVTGGVPSICKVQFNAPMKSYKLHTPNVTLAEDEEYPVVIVIYMENVEQ